MDIKRRVPGAYLDVAAESAIPAPTEYPRVQLTRLDALELEREVSLVSGRIEKIRHLRPSPIQLLNRPTHVDP